MVTNLRRNSYPRTSHATSREPRVVCLTRSALRVHECIFLFPQSGSLESNRAHFPAIFYAFNKKLINFILNKK